MELNDYDLMFNRESRDKDNVSDNDQSSPLTFKYTKHAESRSHIENELLVKQLGVKLGLSEYEALKPVFAAVYSGIARGSLERYADLAKETGRTPAALFMWLVGQEPLWADYQAKKLKKASGE